MTAEINNFKMFDLNKVYKKNTVWKPTFDIIVSDCALSPLFSALVFPRVIKMSVI